MAWNWWQSVDTRPQLRGRGLSDINRHAPRRGPMHLWEHIPAPPVQNTVIVWVDGSVTEGIEFGPEVYSYNADVHFIVQGGHDYRCDDLDEFTRTALMNAGYTCVEGRLDLYAVNDRYSDDYPRTES